MNTFLDSPSTDFQRVRDGRASMPLYYDVDLTVARSITGTGANAALVLNLAANSLYIDADTTNGGNAIIHFQDSNLGNTSAPMFVSPGFIANVPFTQILIENAAQAGKRLRIFYGVDIDFQAGVNASISITGSVAVSSLTDTQCNYDNSYKSITNLAAATAEQIIAPGANTNGMIVNKAMIASRSNVPNTISILAKATAPTTVIDGDVIAISWADANIVQYLNNEAQIKIPAGKGLYVISTYAESFCARSALVNIL